MINAQRNPVKELILFLYDKGAIKLGNFTLSSGLKSKFYLDMRILQSYPKYFRLSILLMKKYILDKIGMNNFNYICSIPTSGTIFGSSLAYELFKPHLYVRKSVKNYGTQKTFEGELQLNSKVLFIDDVLTTGNSLLSSIELLKDKSIITDILVFIDRRQDYKGLLNKYDLHLHSIISIDKIFEILLQNDRIVKKDVDYLKWGLEKN
jgi:orotate phosphoribosyltransferase